MSDLQLWLLVLGIVVVVGVYAFNWLQERNHRRRAEAAFDQPQRDVLMGSLAEPVPETRVARDPAGDGEPAHEVATAQPPPHVGWNTVATLEPDSTPIDCTVVLTANAPFPQTALDDLSSAAAALSRPVQVHGSGGAGASWMPVSEEGSNRYRRLKVALQLADRQGVATKTDLDNFSDMISDLASRIGAALELPDTAAYAAQAKALDGLCADVDIAIGISVVAPPGHAFAGTTIRALAEADGLRLQADGLFHSETAPGVTQFTLDNQDPEPFFVETIRSMSTAGITFLLDVPRASGGIAAFDRMVDVAQQFARSLDGKLVDDNRQPLNDAGIEATRRALAGVFATMEARGIAPGGPLALRLFS